MQTIGPETPEQADNEAWMESLGAKLVEVTFYSRGRQYTERHVRDPDTLAETVRMTCDRLGGMAVIPDNSGWLLVGSGEMGKRYPSKEAAEMVAIHRG